MAQSFDAWWAGLGPIAKVSVIGPMAMALGITLGLVSPFVLVLFWDKVISDFEIWRLATSTMLFGKFSFPFLMNLAMLVIYQQRHEEDFGARIYDHAYMLLVMFLMLLPISYFMTMAVLSFSMTMAIVWVWCKRHEEADLELYGFRFKAQYFPWILVLLHLLLGNSIVDDIIGIFVGHAFFFLKDILPQTNGLVLVDTPQWFRNFFAQPLTGRAAVAAAQQPNAWGAGRPLGR